MYRIVYMLWFRNDVWDGILFRYWKLFLLFNILFSGGNVVYVIRLFFERFFNCYGWIVCISIVSKSDV